jgi:predicted PurR-regulated permease PerM
VVVGLSDNLVKPLLMKDRMEVHGALIFFAMIGGMAMFGAVGLVAGPLILAFFMSVIRLFERDAIVRSAGQSSSTGAKP